MKKVLHISILILFFPFFSYGQDIIQPVKVDSIDASGFNEKTATEILSHDETLFTPVSNFDSTKTINYWRITERTGERVIGRPDTTLTDYFNRTNVEGMGIAVAYPGNLGLPLESRIFFDRPDRSNFIFLDPYYGYAQAPDKFDFITTRIPYSRISYQTAGSRETKEERLLAAMSVSFGKKLNIGFDMDYLYARGYYNSQAAKHMEWVIYGSYIADRHQLHVFINPADYTNAENGGITNDDYISHPERTERNVQTRSIPTNFQDTWNHIKGTRYYLNYHYNLGFERTISDTIQQFIPVSSIIYTFDYTDKKRNFYTEDTDNLDNFYDNRDFLKTDLAANDSTSYWSLRNTVGLSMREGFSSWAKFDLTAFLTQDLRSYSLMDTVPLPLEKSQSSTYIGGELAKRTGKILRYDAQGSFGVIGYNLGDYNVSGNIETRIPVLKDTAAVKVSGAFKNLAPTFYENTYHSKYFWWDKNFSKVRKVYLGGSIDIPHTKTNLNVGVENITNYIYFDETGYPKQHSGDIQVLAATLQQNIKLGGLHWDNQFVYQTTSDQNVLPLPDLSLYSSLYFQFKVAKVLTIQMGGNLHYFSKYYSPTYEPATQQFRLQKEKKVGEYPLINGFVNCHLKQTRFFIEFYNLSSSFISPPEYFSMPHYPLNPQVFKMGLSIDFHN